MSHDYSHNPRYIYSNNHNKKEAAKEHNFEYVAQRTKLVRLGYKGRSLTFALSSHFRSHFRRA